MDSLMETGRADRWSYAGFSRPAQVPGILLGPQLVLLQTDNLKVEL
jgi:hypothetical protein